jgi:hypothetical protein
MISIADCLDAQTLRDERDVLLGKKVSFVRGTERNKNKNTILV